MSVTNPFKHRTNLFKRAAQTVVIHIRVVANGRYCWQRYFLQYNKSLSSLFPRLSELNAAKSTVE